MFVSKWFGRFPAVSWTILIALALGFLGFLGCFIEVAHAQDVGVIDAGVVGAPVIAPPVALTPADVTTAVDTIKGIIGAGKGAQWALLAGLILTALVWVARRFTFLLNRVPTKYVPWVSLAIAIAGSIGTALVAGAPVVDALLAGAKIGAVSIASWELAGQHVLPDPPNKA